MALTRSNGPRFALTAVTGAFSAMLLSANLATPLYAVWARQFGFSTAVLALIFAVYALVLIPALLLFGQLSDRLGRRPVIATGLGLAMLALVLFALATAVVKTIATRMHGIFLSVRIMLLPLLIYFAPFLAGGTTFRSA